MNPIVYTYSGEEYLWERLFPKLVRGFRPDVIEATLSSRQRQIRQIVDLGILGLLLLGTIVTIGFLCKACGLI